MTIKKKNKIECSKLIILASYILTISLTSIMVIGAFIEKDMSSLENIVLASWGELSAANVWYFIKAKVENRIKIISSLPKELKEQVDINQIINN